MSVIRQNSPGLVETMAVLGILLVISISTMRFFSRQVDSFYHTAHKQHVIWRN